MILRACLCTDSSLSERETGIDCHTGMAYSMISLIVVIYTFRIQRVELFASFLVHIVDMNVPFEIFL